MEHTATTLAQDAMLVAAGVVAGGINTVAGGGGFITLPALMATGLHEVAANASSTVAVWPGSLAGMYAYREELRANTQPLGLFMAIGVVGGIAGGLLLLRGGNARFAAALPWLLLAATLLFAFGDRITAWAMRSRPAGTAPPRPVVLLLVAAIAVYGGYFGGGMGIMTLAVLALLGLRDIHAMNAVKTLLVATINAAAVVLFACAGVVEWRRCLAMAAGCILGGYVAGRVARRIDRRIVRGIVLVIAVAMTAAYAVRAWVHAR